MSPRFALDSEKCLKVVMYTFGNVTVNLLDSKTGSLALRLLDIPNSDNSPSEAVSYWVEAAINLNQPEDQTASEHYNLEIAVWASVWESAYLLTFREISLFNNSCVKEGRL